jgi:hypothetical protein
VSLLPKSEEFEVARVVQLWENQMDALVN